MISQLMSEAVRTRSTILRERLSAQLTAEYRLRCLSINTHRGQGPKLSLLRDTRSPEEAQRIALMHDTRAYAYFIAEWLNTHRQRYDVVALQEVFSGILGVGERIVQKYRQRDHYRVLSGFASYLEHGVGFAGFRYQNLLLSQMPKLSQCAFNRHLPGKVFFLASCGFTLAPFLLKDVIVWIGNTHLHAYSPAARMRQARSIAQVIRSLGDVPVVFMGDFNTVPEVSASTVSDRATSTATTTATTARCAYSRTPVSPRCTMPTRGPFTPIPQACPIAHSTTSCGVGIGMCTITACCTISPSATIIPSTPNWN